MKKNYISYHSKKYLMSHWIKKLSPFKNKNSIKILFINKYVKYLYYHFRHLVFRFPFFVYMALFIIMFQVV